MTEAPRWRLMTSHYLNVPGTEWEHNESDRTTGKAVRKLYTVPALLDPRNPQDCNRDGDCVVAHAIDGLRNERGDVIFLGDPTPDMEPMNDEAEEISDSLKEKWAHPIDTLPANGGMNDAEKAFMEKMMLAFTGAASAANQTVPKSDYDALLARVLALESAGKVPAPAAERRV
jgi:hypothetical protein